MEKIKVSVKLHCPVKDVFSGWFKDTVHSAYTGGLPAKTSPSEGHSFSVCGGYITGSNVDIFPYKKIIQKWRTTDFADTDPDSILELFFVYKDAETLITITHTNLPDGDGEKYKGEWKDKYFVNMKKYFS